MTVGAEKAVIFHISFWRETGEAEEAANVIKANISSLTAISCEAIERSFTSPMLITNSASYWVVTKLTK
jgi:hypothetical protein